MKATAKIEHGHNLRFSEETEWIELIKSNKVLVRPWRHLSPETIETI